MEREEILQKQLAAFLNRDKIKLWELPYTNPDGTASKIPCVREL